MSRRTFLCHLALFALMLIAASACASSASEESDIPDLTQTELDRHIGQVVLLNFWAGWCAPCRSEMPALQAVYENYQDQGLAVLGVNVSESGAEVAKFADSRKLTFPMFTDPEQEFMKAYNVRSLPTTLFINAKGTIVKRHVGAMTQSFLQSEVESLLR